MKTMKADFYPVPPLKEPPMSGSSRTVDTPFGAVTIATIPIEFDGYGLVFKCPSCTKRVSVARAYPLAFGFTRCKGCQRVWTNHMANPPMLRIDEQASWPGEGVPREITISAGEQVAL